MNIIKHPKFDVIVEINEDELSLFKNGILLSAGKNNENKTYYYFTEGIWILLIQIDTNGVET